MKQILHFFLLIILGLTGFSQAQLRPSGEPAGYYNSITNQTCGTLKTALYNIISSGTTVLSYTPGVWNAIGQTDIKRNFENTRDIIWDMYSNRGEGQNEPYEFVYQTNQCGNYNSEGDCYNREHSFPASWFNDASPMYTDINQLFPTDGYVNNIRGNLPFGETTSPNYTAQNGGKRGPSSFPGYSGTVFEPINEYKGDFARVQLYMAVRYDNLIAGWQNNTAANEVLNGTKYPSFDDWYIKLLYKWHLQDPVSVKEQNRNDAVYSIQRNRNPFVDHPEWVYAIWSCTGLIAPSSVNDVLPASENSIRFYPNPLAGKAATIQLEKAFFQTVNLQVIDITGRILKQIPLVAGQRIIQLPATELSKGMYILKIQAKEGVITKSFIVE